MKVMGLAVVVCSFTKVGYVRCSRRNTPNVSSLGSKTDSKAGLRWWRHGSGWRADSMCDPRSVRESRARYEVADAVASSRRQEKC